MKTKNAVKYLIILTIILSSSFASAEEVGDIYGHIILGRGYTFHENILYQSNIGKNHKTIPESDSSEFGFGLGMETDFYQSPLLSQSLALTAMYRSGKLMYSEAGIPLVTNIDNPYKPGEKTEIKANTQLDTELNFKHLEFKFLYRLKFNAKLPFGFVIGPNINYTLQAKSKETYKINDYRNPVFPDTLGYKLNKNKTLAYLYDDEIKNLKPIVFSLTYGAFVGFNYSKKYYFFLELNYTQTLAPFVNSSDWHYTRLDFILGVKISRDNSINKGT